MNQYKDHFEKKIAKEIIKYGEQIIPPDKEKIWSNIEKELKSSSNKPKISLLKKVVSIAAIFIILFSCVLVSTNSYASANFKFLNTIKSLFNNVFHISGSTQLIEKEEIEMNSVRKKKLLSLNEAQKTLDYKIIIPAYIPQGYVFKGVFIHQQDNSFSRIELYYEAKNQKNIIIEEKLLTQDAAFSFNFRTNDAQIKTFEINKAQASLVSFNNTNEQKLILEKPGMLYIITGSLSEKEMINVAKSI